MEFLSSMMIAILNGFYRLVPNYGVAIILFTIAMKVILYPLNAQALRSMHAMQKLQPKMKEIQEKYKDDPKQQQERVMQLYKDEKINPLGGCLPMLLQFPIFMAIIFAIPKLPLNSPGSSFLWIENLAKSDPMNILIVLIALSTYWTQKTMPQTAQGPTSVMMMAMPIVIAFVSMPFPAGLQLFWLTQTVLTGLQQALIMNTLKQEEVK